MNAIELKNVSYQTKDFQLKDISFKVPKGFVTGFIGGNGAGKTTVILFNRDNSKFLYRVLSNWKIKTNYYFYA